MAPKIRQYNLFCMIFICLCISSFVLSMFVPIYTDEIIWKVMQGRMGYDHFHNISLLLTCAHEIPTPRLLVPFYPIDTAIYQHLSEPFLLRAIGGVLALVWGLLCWILLRKVFAPAISSRTVALGILGFSTLGVMPFLLVLNRPEQVLLLAVTAMAVPLIGDPQHPNRAIWADLLVAIILTFGCGYILSAHPRGLMILPLMLLFAACFLSRRSITIAVGAVLLVIARTALRNWDSRPLCDDPALLWENVHDNLMFAIHTGQLQYYAKELLKSFSLPEFIYFMSFQLRRFPGNNIFPGAPSTIALPISALTVVAFAVFVVCGAVAFLIGAVKTFKTRRE